ncbi:MAG: ABC transporter ATP-binding protein [Actinobacteria bacterium]|nr:ABC transporter ATP-binding protein [Actinomycetota bacterium]
MTERSVAPTAVGVPSEAQEPVLQVADLQVYYDTPRGVVKAVDGVSFEMLPGERLGLVGESGSGKSTLALALMRLHKPPARIVGGTALLAERGDLLSLCEEETERVRLADIALVPQGAMNSLNPVMRVREQIIDGIRAHTNSTGTASLRRRVGELLETVGLSREVGRLFPHELSGGMKQRVAIAIATALRPKVIIADEPTSALDVVVQRQVMRTLGDIQRQIGAAVLLVGHDMGLMAQFVHRLGVMYAGRLVELGTVRDVLQRPQHPYTKLLIESVPTMRIKRELVAIPGLPPTLINVPPGCPFHPRCPSAFERCSREVPRLQAVGAQRVACHLYDSVRA